MWPPNRSPTGCSLLTRWPPCYASRRRGCTRRPAAVCFRTYASDATSAFVSQPYATGSKRSKAAGRPGEPAETPRRTRPSAARQCRHGEAHIRHRSALRETGFLLRPLAYRRRPEAQPQDRPHPRRRRAQRADPRPSRARISPAPGRGGAPARASPRPAASHGRRGGGLIAPPAGDPRLPTLLPGGLRVDATRPHHPAPW